MSELNKIWNPETKRFVKLNGRTGKKVLKEYLQYLSNISKMYGGSKNKGTLHIFKAEWCGYCRDAMPLFNTLKKDSKNKNYEVVIHEYTNKNEIPIFKNFNIQSFPTLVFEDTNNNREKYENDERTENKINDWINSLGF